MKRFGARGALSDPPQLGESVVVPAWEAEAAIAKVAEAAVVQILGSDQDTRDALTEAFRQGQRDMLAKCIAAVEAWALENPYEYPSPNRIIADLRALEDD